MLLLFGALFVAMAYFPAVLRRWRITRASAGFSRPFPLHLPFLPSGPADIGSREGPGNFSLAIPFILTMFPLYAAARRVPVYEEFVEGKRRKGFRLPFGSFPFLWPFWLPSACFGGRWNRPACAPSFARFRTLTLPGRIAPPLS